MWTIKDPAKNVAAMDTVRDNPRYAQYVKDASGDLAFAVWLALVDKRLHRLGIGYSDLADFNSYDLFEAGVSPREGAAECLANDDGFSIEMFE